jgi:hydroxypyruvate isomerase
VRVWTRAQYATVCGCGQSLAIGAPVLQLVIGPQIAQSAPIEAAVREATWTVTKTRCARCADEAAPADLPVLVERVSVVQRPMVRLSECTLPLDFKMIAAGDREVGEDDN